MLSAVEQKLIHDVYINKVLKDKSKVWGDFWHDFC